MTAAKRDGLPRPGPTTENPGLLLDRYLADTSDNNESARQLYQIACASAPSDLYRQAFSRWEQTLLSLPATTQTFRTRSRMIVGLGSESVRESGITLHRTYGLPYIPGSALKGLLARYLAREVPLISAEERLDNPKAEGLTKEERNVLTGTPGTASYLTFFDAWYVARPGDGVGSPFRQDVITVHHPVYYAARGTSWAPWDFDDPIPVPFVSAAGNFLIAIHCPGGPDWEKIALNLLTDALRDWGIGGKTSSGYGRMIPFTGTPAAATSDAPPLGRSETATATTTEAPLPIDPTLSAEAVELLGEVHGLSADDPPRNFDLCFQQWQMLDDATDRRVLAAEFLNVLNRTGLLRTWASRPVVQEIIAAAQGTGP